MYMARKETCCSYRSASMTRLQRVPSSHRKVRTSWVSQTPAMRYELDCPFLLLVSLVSTQDEKIPLGWLSVRETAGRLRQYRVKDYAGERRSKVQGRATVCCGES